MADEKLDLITRIQEVHGRIPIGTVDILNLLTRPDVIEHTKSFIRSRDSKAVCLTYKAPWNCAKEAEAKYENLHYGWMGASNEQEYQYWCDNCRSRIVDNE